MVRLSKVTKEADSFFYLHQRPITVTLFVLSLLFLTMSSLYVGHKSGLIHSNNHDNIIANYLFESRETFQEALFPAAHSFLIKWPVFALSAALGNTLEVYVFGTIALYLSTILGFFFVIFLLSRKNLLITAFVGMILSFTLLMTPPQPIDGALLPLNMAMITTRNIEFLLLFGFIYLVLRANQVLSWRFVFATLTLSVLGASDKFYLLTSLVASLLYVGFQYTPLSKTQRESIRKVSIPLTSSFLSYIMANMLLAVIDKYHITNIPNPTSAAPFPLVGSVWKMLEAIAGGIQVVVANFGANIFGRFLSASLAPYLLNGIILLFAAYCCFWVARRSSASFQKRLDFKFVLLLILMFVSSFIVFISSEHNYVVGGRYLTVAIFAGMSAVTLFFAASKYKRPILAMLTAGLLMLSPLYMYAAHKNYANSFAATYNTIGERANKVADIMESSNIDVFAGDYWFVLPVRLKTDNTITPVLMSTEKCNTPNNFLTTGEWYEASPQSETVLSAVNIVKDPTPDAQTFNHGCTLEYLNDWYGDPVAEYVIEGTENDPINSIRVYDYDIRERLKITF